MRKIILTLSLIAFLALPTTASAANILRINGRTFSSSNSLRVSFSRIIRVVNTSVSSFCSLTVNGVSMPCN